MNLRDDGCGCFTHCFMLAQGESKVPPEYNFWASFAALAACSANRVWVEKIPGERLFPNIYVLLVGTSGIAKGAAISAAVKLVRDLPVSLFYGKITAQFLMDCLSEEYRGRRPAGPRNTMFLVNEELGFSFAEGQQARDLVKTLVALYKENPVPVIDGTRTGGLVSMPNTCITFLAGTTDTWLAQALPSDSVSGGFSRRIFAIDKRLEDTVIYSRPVFPPNRDILLDALRARCTRLLELSGPFAVLPEADTMYEDMFWGRGDIRLEDPLLHPWLSTQDELAYKMAMLVALGCYEDRRELVITGEDMFAGWKLTSSLKEDILRTVRHTFVDKESKDLAWARLYMEKGAKLPDQTWAKACAARHIMPDRRRALEETLMSTGELTWKLRGSRKWWEWTGRRELFPAAAPLSGSNGDGSAGEAVPAEGALLPGVRDRESTS